MSDEVVVNPKSIECRPEMLDECSIYGMSSFVRTLVSLLPYEEFLKCSLDIFLVLNARYVGSAEPACFVGLAVKSRQCTVFPIDRNWKKIQYCNTRATTTNSNETTRTNKKVSFVNFW